MLSNYALCNQLKLKTNIFRTDNLATNQSSKLLLSNQPFLQPQAAQNIHLKALAFNLSFLRPAGAQNLYLKAFAFESTVLATTSSQNITSQSSWTTRATSNRTKRASQSCCFRIRPSCNHQQLKTYISKILLWNYQFGNQQKLKTCISKLLPSNCQSGNQHKLKTYSSKLLLSNQPYFAITDSTKRTSQSLKTLAFELSFLKPTKLNTYISKPWLSNYQSCSRPKPKR